MLYPMIEDYKDSFRNPDSYFDALKPLFTVPAPWDSSEPHFTTGGFAVVFKLKDAQGKSWAFKCFTQEVDDRKDRLQAIATHLQTLKSPYFLDFKYMEKELWVCSKSAGDKEYPVVVMQWIEGKTLGKYIKEVCEQENHEKLYDLLQNCVKMFAYLLDSGMAHGDLKHDNIMVKPNGDVVLIDYDGMYVPTLWHKEMVELGSPSYQHPNRQNNGFNPHLDHFSMLIILTSLYALYLKPSLKTNNDKSDNLLFQQSDFLNPAQSPNFQALASLQNPLLDALTNEIKKVLTQPLFLHIPKLRDFLGEMEKVIFERKNQKSALTKEWEMKRMERQILNIYPKVNTNGKIELFCSEIPDAVIKQEKHLIIREQDQLVFDRHGNPIMKDGVQVKYKATTPEDIQKIKPTLDMIENAKKMGITIPVKIVYIDPTYINPRDKSKPYNSYNYLGFIVKESNFTLIVVEIGKFIPISSFSSIPTRIEHITETKPLGSFMFRKKYFKRYFIEGSLAKAKEVFDKFTKNNFDFEEYFYRIRDFIGTEFEEEFIIAHFTYEQLEAWFAFEISYQEFLKAKEEELKNIEKM